MAKIKQNFVLGRLFASGSRLHLVIGVSLLLLALGMQSYAAAQDKPLSNTQATELREADELDKQGKEHFKKAEYDAALTLFENALQIHQKAFDKNNPKVAQSLNNIGELHHAKGNYELALLFYKRALVIREQSLGPNHLDVAESLNGLASLYTTIGGYEHTELLHKRALAIREKTLGPSHPDVAESLNSLGELYIEQGREEDALPLLEEALAISERVLGPNHHHVAIYLWNIANLYRTKGDYKRALSLFSRATVIAETSLGKHHPLVARILNSTGLLLYDKGDYDHALLLYERALAIQGKTLAENHIDTAYTLNDLALLHKTRGAYEQALPLYERALTIYKEIQGEHHDNVANLCNNLGGLYYAKGDYERSLLFAKQALAIWKSTLGERHFRYAISLDNTANIYQMRGDYQRALLLHKQALNIFREKLGDHHPDVAMALNNLADLHYRTGKYEHALSLYRRALTIWENAVGPYHHNVAIALTSLANIHSGRGDHKQALLLLKRSLAIKTKNLGQYHPLVATALNSITKLHWSQGNGHQAATYLQRAMSVRAAHIRLVGAIDPSQTKRLLLTKYSSDIDATITFALEYNQPQAKSLALTALLSRKGRASDSMSNAFAAVRRRLGLDEQKLFDEYRSNRTIYARQLLRGPGRISREQHKKNLKQLQRRAYDLEQAIAKRSKEFGNQMRPVTIDSVQTALPAGSMLVEWMRYRVYDPRKPKEKELGEERYAASILGKIGDPVWIDLGAAEPIDKLIKEWRSALARRLFNADELARQLDELVMAPVRDHLGDTTHVFLSPDGPLNLVPFAALVDEQGRHLVERYLFTYLTSGRDLLRIDQYKDAKAQSPALIVADPQYNIPGAPAVWGMQPLFNVMAEAKEVQNVFPNATLLTGNQATEKALKEVRGPAIVHLATHGYFSPTTCGEKDSEVDRPSLKSGVALAGANACRSPDDDNDDGLLTALEAASIDLYGTELAVLSACDTGVGGTELHDDFLNKDIGRGDGVQGLRRALVLAGAKTQMVSLWPVDNIKTRKLMTAYYGKLAEGKGRSEALREVQIEFMQDKELSHPNAWAAFIVSGDSSPLNLPMAKPHPGKVRGLRGCACDMTSADRSAWPGGMFLALLTLGLLYRMRRRLA